MRSRWPRLGFSGLLIVLAAGCAESAAGVPSSSLVDQRTDHGPDLGRNQNVADEDLWSMVPAEADMVLIADLAKLRQSPWTRASFAKASSLAPGDGEKFDAVRGMDRVMFAKLPALKEGASIVVAQGNVDAQAIRKGFEREGTALSSTRRVSYRNAELLVRDDEALAFLGKRTVISGFALGVRAAIDCNVGIAATLESESWLKQLRRQLDREGGAAPVAAMYVHLQPATREALMNEVGEGDTLEDFGARIDLGADLDASAIGVVRSDLQARDLAGRLGERIRDVKSRPIVAALGLTQVIDSLHFVAKDNLVRASLHVSQSERDEIAERMSMVAEMIAKMKTERTRAASPGEPKQDPRPMQDKP